MAMKAPSSSFWVTEHADMTVLSVCLNINLACKFGRVTVDLLHRLCYVYAEKVVWVKQVDYLCQRERLFFSLHV